MTARALVFVSALVLLSACMPVSQHRPEHTAPTPKEVTLTEADDSGIVNLGVGDTLALTLSDNPSTGFSWVVDSLSEDILEPAGQAEAAPNDSLFGSNPGNRIGASRRVVLRFEAVRRGQTTLSLTYRRPFEAAPNPAQTFNITVFVD